VFKETNCKVYFPAHDRGWICLSGSTYSAEHEYKSKLADLLFAWKTNNSDFLACVLELKSGVIRVSGVVEQLQHGAQLVDDFLKDITVNFLPVLVHGAISTTTYRELAKHKVSFRGEGMGIDLLKCGGKVDDLKWPLSTTRRT
jgi:hypothetical protein